LREGHIATEWYPSDLVVDSVYLALPDGGAKAYGKDFDDKSAPASDKEVSQFVDEDGEPKKESYNSDGE
jgi:hypothetical protein